MALYLISMGFLGFVVAFRWIAGGFVLHFGGFLLTCDASILHCCVSFQWIAAGFVLHLSGHFSAMVLVCLSLFLFLFLSLSLSPVKGSGGFLSA